MVRLDYIEGTLLWFGFLAIVVLVLALTVVLFWQSV
jgi:hypothetical protein